MAKNKDLPEVSLGDELRSDVRGFKTTTVRIPQNEYDRADMFATAMGLNFTEYTRDALTNYNTIAAQDPRVLKTAKRRAQRALAEYRELKALAGISDNGAGDEDDADDEDD